LKVAIIGGGPAGLAAAIAFNRLSFVDWKLYEKKPVISEIGNGLSIQKHTWRILELLGAAHHITTDDFFRPEDNHSVQHRTVLTTLFSNGQTAQLLDIQYSPDNTPSHQLPCRAHRSKLQQALLKEVDQSRVQVGKSLVGAHKLNSGKIKIEFEGGYSDEVDLIVGADGIRSVVRAFAFPDHKIAYTGAVAYRTIVRTSDALKINGIPKGVTFWHGTGGNWLYTCPLGGDDFELTAKIAVPASEVDAVSWGRPVPVDNLTKPLSDFSLPIQQLLGLVNKVDEYSFFAGPRLDTVIQHGAVALIGDASHPLSGAFGAGAGFALEDAHVLAQSLEWGWARSRTSSQKGNLDAALNLFDSVRSPHYNDLYNVLDEYKEAEARLPTGLSAADEIAYRVKHTWHKKHNWMYFYEV
ncbi:hypothetical protein B0T10DRAFT_575278, partial [Thelonectria olida]